MTVSFQIKEMTIDELENLLALLCPIDQARAWSEVDRRIKLLKREIDVSETD